MDERAPLTLFGVDRAAARALDAVRGSLMVEQLRGQKDVGSTPTPDRLVEAWAAVAAMVDALGALEPGSMADYLCRSIVASPQWRELKYAVRAAAARQEAHEA